MKLQRRFVFGGTKTAILRRVDSAIAGDGRVVRTYNDRPGCATFTDVVDSIAVRIDDTRADDPPDGGHPNITGYAAVFYNSEAAGTEYWLWDDVVERIMPGAFDRALKEDDVRALFNHDPDNLLGRQSAMTLRLRTDDRGLEYAIRPADTQVGRDLIANIRAENITGSSFSFIPRPGGTVIREEVDEDDKTTYVIERYDVEVWDVGPVTFPAYEATTAGVRSEDGVDPARAEIEEWKVASKAEHEKLLAELEHRTKAVRLAELEI